VDHGLLIGLALLGGALSLDTTAFLQVMASQPIVSGALAGWIVGDPVLGLVLGATLQLVWIGVLPVGATPFPDTAPAAVAAVGSAVAIARGGPPGAWAVAIALLIAFATGIAGQRIIIALRRFNIRLAERAFRGIESGNTGAVGASVAAALGLRFSAGAALTAVALLAASAAASAVPPGGGPLPLAVWAAPLAAASVAAAGRQGERVAVGAGLLVGVGLLLLVGG
jgi:mannose/fructose/N-acetylgalactosamine-specific phosphotransferase system component IIC